MGYNLKTPIILGMIEGILVPYTSMIKRRKEEYEWGHWIEESRLDIGFTPYQSVPRVTRNFRAKTVVYSKEYDSDDSLEIDIYKIQLNGPSFNIQKEQVMMMT